MTSRESFRSEMFAFADAVVDDAAARDPIFATQGGIPGHDHQLSDFSAEAAHANLAAQREARRRLDTLPLADEADRLAHAVMAERLDASVELGEAREEFRTLSVLDSPVKHVRQVFELMDARGAEDAGVIVDRLGAVVGAMASWRAGLLAAAHDGIVAPRRQVLGIAEQAATHARGAYEAFAHRVASSCGVDVETSGLARRAREAQAAVGETGAWLATTLAPRAPTTDASGPARYERLSRYFSGMAIDFDELYEWGLEDLGRIHERMVALGERLDPAASSLVEVATTLDADDAGAVVGTAALLERLEAFTEATVAALDGVHFDIDPRVRRCEAHLAPEGSAAAPYYIGPSEDLSRPGSTWFPTLGQDRFPWWRIASTWYHESVPGHHLQDATYVLRRDELSRFQRTMAWTSGVGEGWALYAERFMDELGAFENPADEFGYLTCQALRAARVVVDLGLHLGYRVPAGYDDAVGRADVAGAPWTPELAVSLLERRVLLERPFAVSEVDRYLGWPGQAITYKVGERVWRATRDATLARLGGRVDLKAFHAKALGMGPMGLAPFVDNLARWDGVSVGR